MGDALKFRLPEWDGRGGYLRSSRIVSVIPPTDGVSTVVLELQNKSVSSNNPEYKAKVHVWPTEDGWVIHVEPESNCSHDQHIEYFAPDDGPLKAKRRPRGMGRKQEREMEIALFGEVIPNGDENV